MIGVQETGGISLARFMARGVDAHTGVLKVRHDLRRGGEGAAESVQVGDGLCAALLNHSGHWGATGKVIVKVVPRLKPALVTVMLPLWATTMALLMVRPMPEPVRSRVRAESPR